MEDNNQPSDETPQGDGNSSEVTPSPEPTPTSPTGGEPFNGLDYTQIEKVLPGVEEANNLRNEYNVLANTYPQGLPGHLERHAEKEGFPLRAFKKTIEDAVETNDFRKLPPIGDSLINARHRHEVVPYNRTFSEDPQAAFENAPKGLIRFVVKRAKKSKIEEMKETYSDLAELHSDFIERSETLRDYNSQDTDKRKESKKKILETFEEEFGHDYTDSQLHEAFVNATSAIGADFDYYLGITNEEEDKIVDDVIGKAKAGREYLVEVIGGSGVVSNIVPGYIRGELRDQ